METTISRFLSWHDCEPECDHDLREVLATDAAQRETMEQQAGEIERLQVELLASRSHVEAWSAQVQKERNTLAAMTAERDEQGRLKADLHQRFKDAQQQLVKQDIMIVELEEKLESVAWEMREQLAASQARVGELEGIYGKSQADALEDEIMEAGCAEKGSEEKVCREAGKTKKSSYQETVIEPAKRLAALLDSQEGTIDKEVIRKAIDQAIYNVLYGDDNGDTITRLKDHLSDALIVYLQAILAARDGQLPEGMRHCTIQFKECSVGHGRLMATNWIDHGCFVCDLDTSRQDAARLREAALWAMKKVKRLSTRAIDYKRADDFIQHEEALKGA